MDIEKVCVTLQRMTKHVTTCDKIWKILVNLRHRSPAEWCMIQEINSTFYRQRIWKILYAYVAMVKWIQFILPIAVCSGLTPKCAGEYMFSGVSWTSFLLLQVFQNLLTRMSEGSHFVCRQVLNTIPWKNEDRPENQGSFRPNAQNLQYRLVSQPTALRPP